MGNRPVLYILLGLMAVAFLVTLPWQRQQWEKTAKMRNETASQQARLKDLQTRKSDAEHAETSLQAAPTDVNARLEAVRAFISTGDTGRAALLLQEVERDAEKQPTLWNDTSFLSTLSDLYQRASWQDRAYHLARRALDLSPDSYDALVRIGFMEAQLGWQSECNTHIKAALRLAPNAAEPHVALALLNDQIGGLSETEKELRQANRLRPDNWHTLLLLGRNLLAQARYADALQIIEKAMKVAPGEPALFSAKADILLERAKNTVGADRLGKLQEAMEAAREYQKVAPDAKEPTFLMGRIFLEMGKEEDALREWEKITDHPQVRIPLGRLLVRRGQKERGGKMIQEAEAERSSNTEWNRLVAATGTKRDNIDRHRQLARFCQKSGRLPRAILEWDQVLYLKPGDTEATQEREKSVEERTKIAQSSHAPGTL